MSISYSLVVGDGPTSSDQLADQLHAIVTEKELLADEADAPDLLDQGIRLKSRLQVHLRSVPVRDDSIKTDFGIDSKAVVTFWVNRNAEPDPQEEQLVSIVTALLERIPDDLILQRDYEAVYLLRRGGEVQVSEVDTWWMELVELVPPPYAETQLAFTEA